VDDAVLMYSRHARHHLPEIFRCILPINLAPIFLMKSKVVGQSSDEK